MYDFYSKFNVGQTFVDYYGTACTIEKKTKDFVLFLERKDDRLYVHGNVKKLTKNVLLEIKDSIKDIHKNNNNNVYAKVWNNNKSFAIMCGFKEIDEYVFESGGILFEVLKYGI